MPAKVDRTQRIVEKAKRAVEQSQAAALSSAAQMSDSGGAGSVGGQSIQDDQGRLKWMWGVSVWGGEDVFVG